YPRSAIAVNARSSVARCFSNKGCDTETSCVPPPSTLARCAVEAIAREGRTASLTGSRLVVVDDNFVGPRIALARQDEPACNFVVLEREVDVHVDFTFDEPAAAGRADAAAARIRQLDAVAKSRFDDVFLLFFEQERLPGSVDDHRDLAFGLRRLRQWARDVLMLRDARSEPLDPDLRFREPARVECIGHSLHHAF